MSAIDQADFRVKRLKRELVNRAGPPVDETVQVGYRWAGATVRVITIGDLTHIYYGETLIRALAIDPHRYYQRTQTTPTNQQANNQNSMKSVR